MNCRSAYSSALMVEVDDTEVLVSRFLPYLGAAVIALAPVRVIAPISAVEIRDLIAMTISRLIETKSDREISQDAVGLVRPWRRALPGLLTSVKSSVTKRTIRALIDKKNQSTFASGLRQRRGRMA